MRDNNVRAEIVITVLFKQNVFKVNKTLFQNTHSLHVALKHLKHYIYVLLIWLIKRYNLCNLHFSFIIHNTVKNILSLCKYNLDTRANFALHSRLYVISDCCAFGYRWIYFRFERSKIWSKSGSIFLKNFVVTKVGTSCVI